MALAAEQKRTTESGEDEEEDQQQPSPSNSAKYISASENDSEVGDDCCCGSSSTTEEGADGHALAGGNSRGEAEIAVEEDQSDEEEADDDDDEADVAVSLASSTSSLANSSASSSSSASLVRPVSPAGLSSEGRAGAYRAPRGIRAQKPQQPRFKRSSGFLESVRKSGRRILSPVIAAASTRGADASNAYRDILSITIHCQMWHLSNRILSHLDSVSLETCEEVCLLWRCYISKEKIWKRVVERTAMTAPELVRQNGWAKYLPALGGKEPVSDNVYRDIYWKMTNLGLLWKLSDPHEKKNHVSRSGSINWCFLPTGRSVSVYNSGRGFVLKIHDDTTHRFRHAQTVTLGTVKKDNLCLDATESQIVVGGLVSQKVWVFNVKEGPQPNKGPLDVFIDALKRQNWRGGADQGPRVYTDIFKFINAGAGVSKVKLHSDGKRMAVLLPLNQTVEIWDIADVIRLQSHAVPSDSSYMVWRDDLLVTAPTYSGIIQALDTDKEREISSMAGSIRRIDALAVYGRLCATGEGRSIKLWNLNTSSHLMSWSATKTFVTALFMNDAMVVSGSSAGIVKLWELRSILRKDASTVQPLRRISMKGMMHYPIKTIDQFSYVDLIIVAKYEAKKKKDKIKLVRVKSE